MSALLPVLPGALMALGLVWIVLAFRPEHARLGDALAVLGDVSPKVEAPEAEGIDRVGEWWLVRRPTLVSPALDRQLKLKGRTITRHYTYKVLAAAAGVLAPLVVALTSWFAFNTISTLPALLSVLLGLAGFVLPDVLIRGSARSTDDDATEALLTYFDLVTLERMANQSATQSLHAAASVSDAAVFGTIRSALERARLQQRMPYDELKELSRQLELPALGDLADVMRLDETGASLAGTLRARVKELRDAHLTQMKLSATEVSERMTVFMVIPSLIFGLIFLVPPLLSMLAVG